MRLEEPEEIVRPSGQETSDTMAEEDHPEPDEPRKDALAAGEIEVETEVAESLETETADGETTDDARSGVVTGADEEIATDGVEPPEGAMPPDGTVAEPSEEPSEEPGSSSGETVTPIEMLRQYRTVIIVAVVALAAVIIIAVALLYKPGVIVVPQGASDYVGQTASDVAGIFEELGFEDVMVIEVPNTAGASTGTVMRISIKGDAEFQAGESFPKEDRVVITEYGVATDPSSAASTAVEEEVEPEEDATEQSSGTSSDAGKTGEEDGLQYAIDDEGNVTITKYVGSDSYVSISSEIDGHPVTKIGANAFEGCANIEDISMWSDIVELGASAFKGCTSLASISLPSSLTVIPDSAFEGCNSLEEALIWGDITSWGKACFKDCTALTEIDISSSTDRIGDSAFQGCTALEDVFFWGCKTIGASAFQGCTALTDVDIPNETTSIESKAFEGCTNLGTVIVWPDEDEITIAPDAFENCPKLNLIA